MPPNSRPLSVLMLKDEEEEEKENGGDEFLRNG